MAGSTSEQLSIESLAALVRAGALRRALLTAELQERIDAFEKGEREEGENEHDENEADD